MKMSIIYEENNCFLIDHRDYMTKLYKNVNNEEDVISYTIAAKLFSILRFNKSRKRSYECDKIHEETRKVNKLYDKFMKDVSDEIKEKIIKKYKLLDTSTVRDLSKELFESTTFNHKGTNGGNNSDIPLKCKIKEEWFLVPPRSRFYCGCVNDCMKLDSTFDIVIADPPWWNKYIRRLKSANDKLSYSMMYNEDIASLPVRDTLSPNSLVAVWCTNSPSNIAAVKEQILPKWGVKYVATWYWLKVTADLLPVCDFGSGCKKQPYERIILGTVGDVKNIPEGQLIVSVPSALHSHKPPLLDLLSPYLTKEKPETLELFARYLLPNTTSIGFEPLKWQHESLYEIVL